ncbi:MAG: prenyltransferase/squalene oxidase repeat-containing protein, partial [Verrucomicrobiota bacterium]
MNSLNDSDPHAPVATSLTLWDKLGGRALTIAIVIHVLVIALGAYWIFQTIPQPAPETYVVTIPPGGGGSARDAEHQLKEKKLKQIVPVSGARRVVAENAHAPLILPEQTEVFGPMNALASPGSGVTGGLGGTGIGDGFGKGKGRGRGLGNGDGVGHLFGPPLPRIYDKRCVRGGRLQSITANGGNPASEDAVLKGLQWLKANQNSDGSWNGQSKVAMTGLALLAYFGHCETPASPEFGESCMSGIVYLVNLGMKNDGRMADNPSANSWSYEHAIATYALGEATTFCKDVGQSVDYLAEVTQKAGQFIIDNQNTNGGWAYAYAKEGGHTDVSVTGWQIQALSACSHTGIKYQGMNSCIAHGLKYLAGCQNANGGFGYTGPASGVSDYCTLTGVGMLCNQMWGKGNSPQVRKATKYVLDNTQFNYNGSNCDLYGHYYESQAMMQSGGEDWKRYNAIFRDQLLGNQE